jgi:hypothetical protein
MIGEPGRFEGVTPGMAHFSSSTGIVPFFGMVNMVNRPASRESHFLLSFNLENLKVSKDNATSKNSETD